MRFRVMAFGGTVAELREALNGTCRYASEFTSDPEVWWDEIKLYRRGTVVIDNLAGKNLGKHG